MLFPIVQSRVWYMMFVYIGGRKVKSLGGWSSPSLPLSSVASLPSVPVSG